jgi:hypothetical protein
VSVRHRVRSVAQAFPILRVLETSRPLLHEHPDPERVQRLVGALRRDGVLRNPPIVTSLSGAATAEFLEDAPVVVLDGANRVTALRELGVPHIAAQVVDYGASEISVSTWTHCVMEDGGSLRERIAARLGLGLVPASGPDDARRRLAQADGIAALLDADGTVIVGPGMDPIENAVLLERLVALYAGDRQIYRIDDWDVGGVPAEFRRGTAVIFPPFGKDEVLRLATGGTRLPAGITRHLIPGRVLRLNVPLAWLQGPETIAIKQSRLDGTLEERWRTHGVRYYAEATYLFDE